MFSMACHHALRYKLLIKKKKKKKKMAVSFRDHDSPGDLNDSEAIVLWIKFLSTDSTFFF